MPRTRTYDLLVNVGDIHGHSVALKLLLQDLQSEYGIFSDPQNMVLEEGVGLQFGGDFIDRGRDSIGVVNLAMRLKRVNPDHVRELMGNHELLALEGLGLARNLLREDRRNPLFEYCDRATHGYNGGDSFIKQYCPNDQKQALVDYTRAMRKSQPMGRWMRSLEPFAISKVGGKSILFVHGGIPNNIKSRSQLMQLGRKFRKHMAHEPSSTSDFDKHYGKTIISASDSLFWNRDLAESSPSVARETAERMSVDYIVFGHTPGDRIENRGNCAFNIDVGMCPAYGENTPAAIVFRPDGVYGFYSSKGEETLVRH